MSGHGVVSVVTGLPRPIWRGRLHTWAFWATLPAVACLVLLADRGRVAPTLYGFSLAAVFGVSAAYHRLARSPRAQHLMRRLDHSMIFLLIAGTYTPVCLSALPPRQGVPLLCAVWALAALGISLKAWGAARLLRMANGLYILIGWLAVLALPAFVRAVSGPALVLMITGGLLYSIGAIIFFLQRPDPDPRVFGYHEIWHAFTIVAGACHFAMVALVVA